MIKDIEEGLSDNAMFRKYLGKWHQYKTTLREFRRGMYKQRRWITRTEVYYGDTEMGKTRRAWHEADKFERMGMIMMPGRKGEKVWGDNLEGAQAVIMEDFEPEIIPHNMLLRMLDRVPLNLDIKFGSVNFAPTNIYITSNYPPSEWYPEHPYEGGPLQRRLKKFGLVVKHTTEWKPPVVVLAPDSDTEDEVIDLRSPGPTDEMLDQQDKNWLAKVVESDMKRAMEEGYRSPYNSDSDNF